uniref:Methyltransferase domain-containing protein n=1 Tax=Photinus pyralis TaxID=7054 RepID=A0A1Y1JVD7_PHOPY
MSKAELYVELSKINEKDAERVLKKCAEIVEWREDCAVLDIGCGPGNVTHNVIVPALPKAALIVGIDKQLAVVDYANAKYATNEPRIKFEAVDVVSDGGFVANHREDFHHIFSFYCLQFVRELELALRNIYTMLKPGGSFAFICSVHNDFFSIMAHMAKMEKWTPHISQYENYLYPYESTPHPDEEIRSLLLKVGFQVMDLTMNPQRWKMPFADASEFIVCRIPFELPGEIQREFVLESADAIRSLKMNDVDGNGTECYNFKFTALECLAVKPPLL